MALTQSAIIPGPGPSWDEEVVPALRKRLENESRTLARRLSGMSLITDSHYAQTFSSLANSPAPARDTVSEDTRPRNGYQSPQTSALPSSSRVVPVNSLKKPAARSRTLSQPLDAPGTKQRPKTSGATNGSSPRPSDPKPTRIPKVSKAAPSPKNSPATNHVNGFGQLVSHVPGSVNEVYPDSLTPREHTNPSLSTLGGLSRQVSGILDEPPPFPTGSVSSVTRSQYYQHLDDAPPRLSNDSEEHPFEHWYRGEVSRNGGVGELRVVRRQEMLDIANYGHTIAKRQREASTRTTVTSITDDGRLRRKRADSVGEIGRPDRDSLLMDEDHMDHMGRVLDEDPLTDIDGADFSDTQSTRDYLASSTGPALGLTTSHQTGDSSTASEPLRSSQDSRSTTPTPTAGSSPPTDRHIGSSRIPSLPRRSSEARATTPVQQTRRGASESASSIKSPSTPRAQRQLSKDVPTPSTAHKRAVSPMSPRKPKSTGAKATRSKPKKETSAEDKRKSVAAYPLSNGTDDMADAIPSWTQPKPREGNWDEVVLPVVARKKGLEDHYEHADGSPQPKKVVRSIEPAPGTFGFNHSKYRLPQNAENTDDFGRQMWSNDEEGQDEEKVTRAEPWSASHDEARPPVRTSPSPAPFAEYAPIRAPGAFPTPVATKTEDTQFLQLEEDDDKGGAGCCKCVIM